MKHHGCLSVAIILALSPFVAWTAFGDDWVCKYTEDSSSVLVVPADHSYTIQLDGITPSAFRVRIQKKYPFINTKELVFKEIKLIKPTFSQNQKQIEVKLPNIHLTIQKDNGQMSFLDQNGNVLFSEIPQTKILPEKEGEFGISEFRFDSPKTESLFGLGEFQDETFNIRNLPRRLIQVNTQAAFPFMFSTRKFGFFWHNYSRTDFNPATEEIKLLRNGEGAERIVSVTTGAGRANERRRDNFLAGEFTVPESGEYAFELDSGLEMARQHVVQIDGKPVVTQRNTWLPPVVGFKINLEKGKHTVAVTKEGGDRTSLKYRLDNNQTVFRSHHAYGIDFAVFAGDASQTLAEFRQLTGKAPLLPLYAFGYWHCRERFHNQNEFLDNLKEFRARKIPVDIFVQDWQWWDDGKWNSMHFDSRRFSDPKKLTDEVHKLNAHAMLSIWSKTDKNCDFGRKMREINGFVGNTDWIDFSKKEAADLYATYFKDIIASGFDTWWFDAVEPENDALRNKKLELGDGNVYRSIYPILVNDLVAKTTREAMPKQRTIILTRCMFAGQTYCPDVLWSGDVGSSWQDFRTQIVCGLGVSMSGIPYWTTDTGGFFRPGDQYTNRDYHKRFIRWFEFSTFNPILRVHGYTSNTEPWRYGEEVEKNVRRYLDMRYHLLPYTYTLAANTAHANYVMMRPLVMDFLQDPESVKQDTEFMFGPSFLVCPVTEDTEKQMVYLPKDEDWINFWTGEKLSGGKNVSVDAPLDRIPLFVRAGSIIPWSEAAQYAGEKKSEPIEIRVYPGKDASFTLYEDNGSDFEYENGKYTRITFTWNDKDKKLTIGNIQGQYDEMQKERIFRVVLMDSTKSGMNMLTLEKDNVKYNGAKIEINLK